MSKTQAWYDAMHARKGRGTNQYTFAEKLGLPKPVFSDETLASLRERALNHNPMFNESCRNKISQTALEKSLKGEWHTSLAKRMHYSYRDEDLHGKWELAYAMYLDQKGTKWERCKHRFAYRFEGKIRFYTPDFYLPIESEYIEIKGYETEKDRAKWSQFPKELTLRILKGVQLKELLKEFPDINSLVKV